MRRLCRPFFLSLHIAYLFIYVLPWLKLNSVFKGRFKVSLGYQSILVSSEKIFIKIALSKKSTIKKEYLNYCNLIKAQPLFASIFPRYYLLKGWFVTALVCERVIGILPSEALPIAVNIQKIFNQTIVHDRRLVLGDCPQIEEGLRCIRDGFGEQVSGRMQAIAEKFLLCDHYQVGLIHGDFHSRNLMKDEFGNPKVIDLDCVRQNGIRQFDALYFALEQEWSLSGTNWTKSLAYCLDGVQADLVQCLNCFEVKWSKRLGVAFFLDRLGQDILSYKIRYSRGKLQRFITSASKERLS
jgi:hypothetical protein